MGGALCGCSCGWWSAQLASATSQSIWQRTATLYHRPCALPSESITHGAHDVQPHERHARSGFVCGRGRVLRVSLRWEVLSVAAAAAGGPYSSLLPPANRSSSVRPRSTIARAPCQARASRKVLTTCSRMSAMLVALSAGDGVCCECPCVGRCSLWLQLRLVVRTARFSHQPIDLAAYSHALPSPVCLFDRPHHARCS